jgi:hypothetical protein
MDNQLYMRQLCIALVICLAAIGCKSWHERPASISCTLCYELLPAEGGGAQDSRQGSPSPVHRTSLGFYVALQFLFEQGAHKNCQLFHGSNPSVSCAVCARKSLAAVTITEQLCVQCTCVILLRDVLLVCADWCAMFSCI